MALNDMVDKFEAIATANSDVKSFHAGNFSDINTLNFQEFPVAVLIAENGTDNDIDSFENYDVQLLIVDVRNKKDKDLESIHEQYARLSGYAKSIWTTSLNRADYAYDKEAVTKDFFKNAFNGKYTICRRQSSVRLLNCT